MFNPKDVTRMIDGIIARLFSIESARLTTEEETIIQINQDLTGCIGFMFQGIKYGASDLLVRYQGKLGLDPSLIPRMTIYAADRSRVLLDMKVAKMALEMVVVGCKTTQDLRDAMPEEVVHYVNGLGMARTRPEAYTLQNNPVKMKRYQKMREVISIYSISGLLN